MEIFIVWLVFVMLSLFFWAIGKRKGVTNEDELPFLVKICYTIAQLPFGLIAIIFIVLAIYLDLFLKLYLNFCFFVFLITRNKHH
ncbi:hypothetical protein C2Q47_05060 [Campylobacter coli]|nr:hypothetical protein [Campylobacter coli]